ncbi:MAG: carboxypeptidase regulatory-like domain-containing protein, partial [Planctomycetota bacterium]
MAKTTEAVVLNPQVVWFDGSGAGQPTELWTIDHPEAGTVRFNVHEPGYSVVFNHPVSFDLDVEALPILSLTYRGRGLQDDGQRNPNLLVFFNGCDKGDRPVIPMKGLVWDGQPHTVEVDLREALGDRRSPMKRFDLRIHAHEDAAADGAWFELVDLRFKPAASEADASTDTANEAIQAAEAPQQATDSPPVQVRVTDPAGQPIADAEVVLDPHLRDGVVAVKTDTQGRASVRTTRSTRHGGRSMLRVQAPGTAAVWYRQLNDVSGDTELAVTLHPSMTLGGTVVDAEGQPVANAVGELWMDGPRFSDRTGSPTHAARSMRVRTDTQGRWTSAALPDDRNTRVRVRWMHPGFLDDRWGGQFSGEPAMADLRAGRGHQVLTKGVAVTGQVFGKDGQPLSGAHVAQGDDRFPSNVPPATRTDGEGRFAFAQTEPGPLVLTVKKAGHAPQLVQTTATEDMQPIEFHLEPASVFRFRVVDADGEPIEGASICPDTWLGFRTIPGRFHTGPDGYAQWEGPADPVEFDVFATQEYAQQRGVTFAPNTSSDEPHVITLGKPLSIELKVVDAQTGEPVTRFTPIPGIVWDQHGNRSPHFQRDNAQAHTSDDGVWSQRFGYPYPFRAIRVEADGYAPAMTELFAEDAGAVSVELRLEPAEGMAGTLLDPAGQPVAGADVYLLYGSAHLQIQNGKVEHSHNVPAVRTDA